MEDFNGPLDLILHLLSKNRMEIKDIQISLILDQYLEWMDQRKRLDLEVASEFVTMAAHLVFIKTRMLLSIHDEEAISEMEQLIASLEEHQRHENFAKIKAIVPELSDRYAIGRDYIPKVPEALPVNRTYRYVHKPEDLLRAMTAVLARVPPATHGGLRGHRGPGALPGGGQGRRNSGTAQPLRCDPVPGSVQGQPEPLGGGGHLYRSAGAVQGPPPAAGRHGERLHRDLYRGGRGRAGADHRWGENGRLRVYYGIEGN